MKKSYDDRGTVDIQCPDDMSHCLRLDVSHVPCIVTLSKVSKAYIYMCMCCKKIAILEIQH